MAEGGASQQRACAAASRGGWGWSGRRGERAVTARGSGEREEGQDGEAAPRDAPQSPHRSHAFRVTRACPSHFQVRKTSHCNTLCDIPIYSSGARSGADFSSSEVPFAAGWYQC